MVTPAHTGAIVHFNWLLVVASHGLPANRISRGGGEVFGVAYSGPAPPWAEPQGALGMGRAWPVMDSRRSRPRLPPQLKTPLWRPRPQSRACCPLETNGRLMRVSDRFSKCGVHSRSCCGISDPRRPGAAPEGAAQSGPEAGPRHAAPSRPAVVEPWDLHPPPWSTRLALPPFLSGARPRLKTSAHRPVR